MPYPATEIDATQNKAMDVLFQGDVAQFQQVQGRWRISLRSS